MAKLSPGGKEKVVALDGDDYLRVFDPTIKPLSQVITFGGTDELIWRSDDVFGGSNTYVETKKHAISTSEEGTIKKAYINVRIVTYDTQDGKRHEIFR
jgi:hypothetical protein